MSFSPDWLSLRSGADARARSAELTRMLADGVKGRGPPLRVLDLGSGTGANLAALAPHLAGAQEWVLVDNDPALLARVEAPDGVAVERRVADVATDLDGVFQPVPDLVTASAFFDLCGADLADAIVARTARAGAVFHTVLTYDGRETWEPPHTLDDRALAAFHADQQRDKGLGPALGPDAAMHLTRAFRAAGYRVATRQSDWELSARGDAALIAALAKGSATTIRADLGPDADDWLAARRRADRVMIGHRDILAFPPGT